MCLAAVQPMLELFWAGALLFHAAVVAASVVVARRWARRLSGPAEPSALLLGLAADAALLGTVALVTALAAAWIGSNGFTAVRLVSQALFGELAVLGAWLGLLLWRTGRRAGALAASTLLVLLLGAYVEGYHRGPTDVRVRRYAVDLSRGGAVRGRLRLLHVSDIQADRIGPYQVRALRLAAAERPDLVVMTGDYVQPRVGSTREQATADLNRLLREWPVAPRLGAYAVRGDVDLDWPRVLAGTRITPLTGDVARIPLPGGASLCLVGLTPRMSHAGSRRGVLELLARASGDCLRIVAGHGPDFVMELEPAAGPRVDLALAGHTHGGQVVLPFFGPPYTKTRLPGRYASGLHAYGGTPIHVSAGIGMERGTAPQVRFLCPPEMSVLEVTY